VPAGTVRRHAGDAGGANRAETRSGSGDCDPDRLATGKLGCPLLGMLPIRFGGSIRQHRWATGGNPLPERVSDAGAAAAGLRQRPAAREKRPYVRCCRRLPSLKDGRRQQGRQAAGE